MHFKSFISFVNQHQWIPQVFAAFMLFWLTAFVIGFSQLVLGKDFHSNSTQKNFIFLIAGVYARYYWDRERYGIPCSSLLASLFRAIIFHLGTIAFGSLIIAIVKMVRGVLEYFEEKVKDKTGTIARFLFCCCQLLFILFGKILKISQSQCLYYNRYLRNRIFYICTTCFSFNCFQSSSVTCY